MAETKKTVADDLVEIDIPEDYSGKKSKHITLSVNGQRLQLERGMTHKVPRVYAEMLNEKKAHRKAGERYKEKNSLK